MRIAMAQLDYKIGDFDANFERIRNAHTEAQRKNAHLVVYSELATTGYPPGDLLERTDFVDRNLELLERIAGLSKTGPAILVGYVDRNDTGRGKPLLNAAALCADGTVVARYVKCLLPSYDVFDEARYFEPGPEARPLVLDGVRLGVSICEDVWNEMELGSQRIYQRDPIRELIDNGADILINLSASPFTLGKVEQRRQLIRTDARESGLPFFYVNQVGGNDELVFDGHSLVVDRCGTVVARARDFAEDLLVYETGPGCGKAEPGTLRPVASSLEEEAFRALVLGVRDYLHKSGFHQVVLGLSGGIDSALTAAIAAEALGPEHVLGVAMPTRYSSEGSVTDARDLAANLGIDFQTVDIDPMFQSALDSLEASFAGAEQDVTEENIQARIRGMVLMALSNKFGRLVLATGNKSELGVGYCTLYGDMCGGLAVISDLPKTLVYRLAEYVNTGGEVIPRSTIDKAPSAELRPDQTDQDSLPPYPVLDGILEAYVEDNSSVEEIVNAGFDRLSVEQVVALIDRNEYKRRQAAPGIKITSKAFGMGRRYPIVAAYPAMHRGERT